MPKKYKGLKIFIILLLVLIVIGISIYCVKMLFNHEDKYTNFEHISESDLSYINKQTFHHEYGNYTYVVANLIDKEYVSPITGILYRIDYNDYIILDSDTMFYDSELINSKEHVIFYHNNKKDEDLLYILNCSPEVLILLEYKLDGTDTTKREIKFDVSKWITNEKQYLSPGYMKYVDDEYVHLRGNIANSDIEALDLKCSLDTYKCELESE